MTERPILFNTEMVKAILDGRKTQTRRFPFPSAHLHEFHSNDYPNGWWYKGRVFKDFYSVLKSSQGPRCRYSVGDVLYVRETWAKEHLCKNGYIYRAVFNTENGDSEKSDHLFTWRPSIHMPKEAARIFLLVKDVRIERLRDITNEAALAEGMPDDLDYPIAPVYCPRCKGEGLIGSHIGHGFIEVDCPTCDTAMKRFINLWTSTIKKADLPVYGWDANPWVWVIEFERCEPMKEG